jgi:predicted nucleotidyltransferase component of viral defense system
MSAGACAGPIETDGARKDRRVIARSHLTRIADDIGAKTVERDYILTHTLAAISTHANAKLVFKGGAALRLC